MRKILLIFLIILSQILPAHSQSKKNKYPTDTVYIKILSHLFNAKLKLSTKNKGFELINQTNSNTIAYSTNETVSLGLTLTYKGFGLSGSFAVPYLNNDNDKFGETQAQDVQVNIYGRKNIIDFNVLHHQGFYLKSHSVHFNQRQNIPISRPDIETFSLGGNYYHVYNHQKFSYRAAFLHNEIQKKSSGSLLLGGFFNVYKINGDSSFIPEALRNAYNDSLSFLQVNCYTFGAGAGYAYTFVLKNKFYITGSIVAGPALQDLKAHLETGESLQVKSRLALKSQVRLSAGYNIERTYFGLSLISHNFTFNTGNKTELGFNFGNIRLFFGKRFSVTGLKGKQKNPSDNI